MNHPNRPRRQPRRLPLTFVALIAVGCALVTPAAMTAAGPALDGPGPSSTGPSMQATVNDALGLRESTIFTLDVPDTPGALSLAIPLDGVERVVDLVPHSVRSDRFEVLAQQADGSFVEVDPGPVRTLRGTVRELPGSTASGALLDEGLRASIRHGELVYWVEPVAPLLGQAVDDYVIYRNDAVLDTDANCGMNDAVRIGEVHFDGGPGPITTGAGTPCDVELAADADVEFFTIFGSVEASQARIEAIINVMNVQYEIQTSITHVITTILVRTAEPDPYSQSGSLQLLCEFITEWTDNQTGIDRDVAVLFTGRNVSGGTIGRAADIGGTGICVSQGACEGGPFDTLGSYCFAQTEFNNNFSCATDLVAHELGHLWGAFHCGCPSNTMNPGITCANNFTAGTINSIKAYRDTRPCIDGACDGQGCCRPDGLCFPVDCNTNGIADECDLSAETSLDCNNNGIPDECDVASGASTDCNANGIADECDVIDRTAYESGQMSPIGAGSPQTFTIVDPLRPTAEVIVSVRGFGEFDGNLNALLVGLNGQNLGSVLAGGSGALNCFESPDQIALSADQFNALVGDGDASFTFTAFPVVDPNFCGDPSYVDATVSIGVPSALDANGNGIVDECECPADITGPEDSPDGRVDALDLLLMLAQWGSPCTGSCEADITGPAGPDGNVDDADLLLLAEQWGSPALCE